MRFPLVGAGKGSSERDVNRDKYDNNFTSIFGEKELPSLVTPGRVRKDYGSIRETADKDVVKMGKEICRMSQLGEKHKHKELAGAINKKLYTFKEDKQLTNAIVKDVLDQYKSERGKR